MPGKEGFTIITPSKRNTQPVPGGHGQNRPLYCGSEAGRERDEGESMYSFKEINGMTAPTKSDSVVARMLGYSKQQWSHWVNLKHKPTDRARLAVAMLSELGWEKSESIVNREKENMNTYHHSIERNSLTLAEAIKEKVHDADFSRILEVANSIY